MVSHPAALATVRVPCLERAPKEPSLILESGFELT